MEEAVCPKCNLKDMVIKSGKHNTVSEEKQRYKCKRCNVRFVIKGKYNANYKDEIVDFALNLHMKGMSAHGISEYLKETQNLKVSHGTISSWIKSFKSKE